MHASVWTQRGGDPLDQFLAILQRTVRQIPELGRLAAERARRVFALLLAQADVGRAIDPLPMAAVGRDHDAYRIAGGPVAEDGAAAAEHLVVRMRGEDQRRPCADRARG
jgi:hypothetical protein